MAAFNYEALDATGRATRGVIESDSVRLARASLRESGLTILSVEELTQASVTRGLTGYWRNRRNKISTSQLSMLTRQLAVLLDAGLTLEHALNALIEQSDNETIRQVLAGVRAEVMAGHTLAQAMSRFGSEFSEIYRSLIKAGEASGELSRVMLRLADYTESRQAMQQKVGLAFVYPVILTVVATLVVGGLLIYVVPQVVSVFQQAHQTLPLLTRMLIGLSNLLQAAWFYLLALVVAAVFSVRRLLRREEVRYQWHLRLMKLPVMGRLLRSINAARMASTLSILSGSGVPLLISLHAACGVVNMLPMRRALEEAAAKVREGVSLSRALSISGMFPPILIHLISSGEVSGRLDSMLDRAAAQQELEVSNYLAALTALLEPVLTLLMGAVVLIIVLAILMPIIEMNQMVH
ncbi:MAG TPA: type II secretion system inner membrane protein GspF [Gallionellaceae bacterium]